MDESGDLGFGAGGSKYFVVAALGIKDSRALDRLIKKENRRLGSNGARSIDHKFNKSSEKVRLSLLRGVSETNSQISWRAIDKENTKVHVRKTKDEIYLMLSAEVLNDIIPYRVNTDVIIHIDRMSSKKSVRDAMSTCLSSRSISDRIGISLPNVRIEHQVPYDVPGLQVQDFVAGSVFQHLERENSAYCQIIENKVISGVNIRL